MTKRLETRFSILACAFTRVAIRFSCLNGSCIRKCALTLFVALFLWSSSALAQTGYGDVETSGLYFETPQLCGVYATYIMLSLVGRNPSFKEVFDSFPGSVANGVTLEEMQQYLSKGNVESSIQWLSEADLKNMASGLAAVLYSDAESPHIVVKRSRNGTVQVIDPQSEAQVVLKTLADTKRRPSLLLTKGSGNGDFSELLMRYLWQIGAILGVSGLSLLTFLYYARER